MQFNLIVFNQNIRTQLSLKKKKIHDLSILK